MVFVPACDVAPPIRIDQSCAMQGGCIEGDAPGFPVRLARAGRYRLASDLVVPDADTTALVVAASHVELDLAGFAITRRGCLRKASPADPQPTPTPARDASSALDASCPTVSGAGLGVSIEGAAVPGLSIRDGRVSGMGGDGMRVGEGATLTRIRARSNGGRGLVAGARSWVADSEVTRNAGAGVVVGEASVVSGSRVVGNGGAGIRAAAGALVHHNAVAHNAGPGLELDDATWGDNTIDANHGGTVVGGRDEGGNRCDGSTCP
ncbi:MAG: right-handed parallel beta-helix repeat-containing protein [Spirochaetaceae bacterium]|nr:right-handed parallel beta-helix repeat-containing protein [Spirochaetaceae bacterium]